MAEQPADARRREIVTTAAQLFEAEGFAPTSMERIARAVGLAKPTLYHYFASKDDILFAIHEEFITLLIERAASRRDAGMSASQELLEIFGDVFDLMDTHRGHVRVFFEHYRELPARQREIIKAKRDAYEQSVEDLIAAGNASGEFRGVNPRLVTLALFGMSNWAYQWFRSDGCLTSRQIAVQFCDYLLHGIGAADRGSM
jgi:AcrR family transcriptional regulator